MRALNEEMLESFREAFQADSDAKRAQAACARTEIKDLVFLPQGAAKLNGDFSVEIKTRGITAQERSGRCWLFAALNVFREQTAEKCNLKEFEFSENYMAFFDKLEKANNLLNMAVEYAGRPLDDRMTEYILDGYWDGGYWDMAVDLIRKYGAVPKHIMPETYQSSHTETFMRLMKSLMRRDVLELRNLCAEGLDPYPRMEEMLKEVYKAQCIAFGEPVKTFCFEYRDEAGEYHADYDLTPQEFVRKYTDFDPDRYITVTNEPTEIRKMNMYYQFHYIGSMAESNVRCLNLTMPELKELAIAQLEDGQPVWFGCDSGAFGDRQEGIWDPDSFDYSGILGGADFVMEKGDRLMYHDSYSSHAMILTGVNFDENGRPDRWKIENSWGKDVGRNGYFVCSDKYFDEYVYEVIIDRRHLSCSQRKLLDCEPALILPWQR